MNQDLLLTLYHVKDMLDIDLPYMDIAGILHYRHKYGFYHICVDVTHSNPIVHSKESNILQLSVTDIFPIYGSRKEVASVIFFISGVSFQSTEHFAAFVKHMLKSDSTFMLLFDLSFDWIINRDQMTDIAYTMTQEANDDQKKLLDGSDETTSRLIKLHLNESNRHVHEFFNSEE